MRRYFCLFLAAFALIGFCSMFLINPVSAAGEPADDPVSSESTSSSDPVYYDIYDMIVIAFYGDGEITGWQELVATTLATAAVVFMFALPFTVVYFLIGLVVHRR